ncbi:MAG TPA: HepT-like ribonuclease domain-containing protein [Xanthobacteraceae bacterium]|jgi:uncharacterized protein with HEPN domain
MAENIRLARSFVGRMSFDDFQVDRRTFYAVVRCLEIISEASRRLPPAVKERHREIPWEDVAGAGNIYRHQYQNVFEILVWQTVTESLVPLQQAIEDELRRQPR